MKMERGPGEGGEGTQVKVERGPGEGGEGAR